MHHVIGRPYGRACHLKSPLKLLGETKVTEHQPSVRCHEDILHMGIAMHQRAIFGDNWVKSQLHTTLIGGEEFNLDNCEW